MEGGIESERRGLRKRSRKKRGRAGQWLLKRMGTQSEPIEPKEEVYQDY